MSMDHFRLFPDDTDPLLRYKADAEERERELAAERRREEREQQRAESRNVALLRREIEDVRAEIQMRQDVVLDACGQCVGEYSNKIFDRVEGMIQSLQRELFALVERRFAETQAAIERTKADVLSGAKREKGEFRFASEKGAEGDDEPVELPNPLPRRAIN
jgi:hypothetical protein